MSFTSFDFLIFLPVVFAAYWLMRERRWQNALLLVASYVFYAWVHPWYAILLGASTLIDYFLSRGIEAQPGRKRTFLWLSLLVNLGVLAFFKYYDFFSPALANALTNLGVKADSLLVQILLPAGLSFYTLKKMSYMFDVSNGTQHSTHSLIDFALYVSFFPQIVAGPIDRARKLLPQFEAPRVWKADLFYNAWPLLVMGFFKKIVIADSIKVIVDQIFSLNAPSGIMLWSGSLGFTLEILADFSAYTDIARGIALLLGFETSENFNNPYLSLTPTDFWNRWHITLSTWLRDYIFFPTRRALMRARVRIPDVLIQTIPPILTMFLSGFWHGAGWTYVLWGLYYGVLIAGYHIIGLGGNWKPKTLWSRGLAWLVMFALIVFGWAMFRAPSLTWLWHSIFQVPFVKGRNDFVVSLIALSMAFVYSLPLWIKFGLDKYLPKDSWLQAVFYALAAAAILVYINSSSPDFIYFQF
ncbi:MAG TPA: MBOAT family O-acyltransferase [Anaerolineales bacterium]|nr:MBOAT family O-acyltransferase [Anaerolineales bacterium]